MAYMTASIARNIAESMWGTGGTSSSKTTRKGVYFFSCAGHGGYVLPATALSETEYNAIKQYIQPEEATVYISQINGKVVYMHPYRTRSSKIFKPWTIEKEEYFVFEEDCAWSILEKFTDIRLKKRSNDHEKYINQTFWNWFDMTNPVVANRELIDQKRKNGDPDLIISAYGSPETEVITAEQKKYIVTGYRNAMDEFNTPYLSLCETVKEV